MSTNNPYQILGVAPTASDDEVKAAYRELAKKYHPDRYADNPLADLAQEKMQEINDAYDAIIRERKQGHTGGSARQTGGYRQSYDYGYASANGNSHFQDIRRLMQEGRILDADTLLDGFPSHERDAEWHFLKGMIFYRKGYLDSAYQYVATAVRMEPHNMEYRNAAARMEQQRNGGYTVSNNECDACDCCSTMMCMNCLCNGCR